MKTRKHIVLIMTLLMLCILTNAMMTLTEAASGSCLTLAELQAKYPDGSKWYGTFDGSIQCAGFARLLCYEAYGSEYYLCCSSAVEFPAIALQQYRCDPVPYHASAKCKLFLRL